MAFLGNYLFEAKLHERTCFFPCILRIDENPTTHPSPLKRYTCLNKSFDSQSNLVATIFPNHCTKSLQLNQVDHPGVIHFPCVEKSYHRRVFNPLESTKH